MKSLTFNKSSWHYRIATKVSNYSPYDEEYDRGDSPDICTYSRHVAGALLLLTLGAALFLGISYILIHVVLGIAFSLMTWSFMFTEIGFAGLIALCMIGFVCGAIYLKNKIEERRNNRRYSNRGVPKPDGFVKNAYKSWKEKYCVRITFVDNNAATNSPPESQE